MRDLAIPAFNPAASPLNTRPMRGTPAANPGPVRPMAPLAPSAPGAAAQPVADTRMRELAASLERLNPKLSALFGDYFQEERKTDAAEAEAGADAMGMKNPDVRTMADAIRVDPTLADKAPFFRGIYSARLAATAVRRKGTELTGEYFRDAISASEDPAAIQQWLAQRLDGALDPFKDDAPATQAATEELRRITGELTSQHVRNASRNLVAKNEDAINSEVGAVFDEAQQKGTPIDVLAGRLQEVERRARAQGVDGRTVNNIMASQTAEAMVRHGRSELRQLGMLDRPDGTKGWGTTAEGRRILSAAEDRIMSRSVQQANLAWTQEQRRNARIETEAMRTVVSMAMDQHKAGQPLKLDGRVIAALNAHDPQTALKAITAFESIGKWSGQTDPRDYARLQLEASRGGLSDGELLSLHNRRIIDIDQFSRLREMGEKVRNDEFLRDPTVSKLIDDAARVAGDPSGLGGAMKQPENALGASNELYSRLFEWRLKNPNAPRYEGLQKLQEWQREIVPLYTGKPINPPSAQAERRAAESTMWVPPPKDDKSHPRYSPEASVSNTMRSVAFPTRTEFEQRLKEFRANPTDPSNPINQWLRSGRIRDLADFERRQLQLYGK